MERVKEDLQRYATLPSRSAGTAGGGGAVNKSILLYGPRGMAKTMLAQAVATHNTAWCLYLPLESVLSKHTSQADKLVRAAFRVSWLQAYRYCDALDKDRLALNVCMFSKLFITLHKMHQFAKLGDG